MTLETFVNFNVYNDLQSTKFKLIISLKKAIFFDQKQFKSIIFGTKSQILKIISNEACVLWNENNFC